MPVYEDVVCPFCGCLCDDIVVRVEDGRIVEVKNGCGISSSKFRNHHRNRILKPMVRRDGKLVEATLEEAVDELARMLVEADWPLIYGLSSTECDAISKAIELGELVGAVVDNTASVCHGPTILALQAVGEPKATLGEMKNRADLVVFWGCNPTASFLRHMARYSVLPKGMFIQGRKDRFVIVVDVRRTGTARLADMFVKVKPGRDFELVQALRAVLRGYDLPVEEVAGVPMDTVREMAERMKACKFGVVFFGVGVTMSPGRHMNVEALVRLVRDLNSHTKFVMMPMRGHFNVAGANTVSTWQTGYPYAVDFSRGYPRYGPGEFWAVDLLSRGEVDAALIVASDPAAHFPVEAARHLARIPLAVMDCKVNMTAMMADVVIPVAASGIECEGTAYRMDGVPIRLKKIVDPPEGVLPDREVLEMVIRRIREVM